MSPILHDEKKNSQFDHPIGKDMPSFKILTRPGMPPEQHGYPGLQPRQERRNGMLIERDVAIELRDGVKVYADIFRPENAVNVPVIIGWGPYGKHGAFGYEVFYKNGGITPGMVSPDAIFEGPDPGFWCPAGYAIAYVDPRGAWMSEGEATFWGTEQEGLDAYDVIEWFAQQPWSNGKVGMSGVSYFTIIQWRAAAARPPHLAAINPWEGFRDPYREIAYIGGMADKFVQIWQMTSCWSKNKLEDVWAMMEAHPLYDEYWADKVADLSEVDIPAYIVASWSDQGLHTRGTISAFNELGSKNKWLEVHGRKKWEYYYRPESLARQRKFFDHFLKGIDTGLEEWPRVRIEVREGYYLGQERAEQEWPLARTEHRPLYLDGSQKALIPSAPSESASVSYSVDPCFSAHSYHDDRAEFDVTFNSDTEITGNVKLKLWVEAQGSDDMDLFVAIQKLDKSGRHVGLPFFSAQEDGPVALGWLRVSHRELDPMRSTPSVPWHLHAREEKLNAGEIVPVEIEIWPSSTLFRKGERLRLVIKGDDIYRYGEGTFTSSHATRNKGRHVIHTGGRYDSHLLLPFVPSTGETS
ncbi:MAG: CocE/NonD family hydrolase [Pigmentiphaga sp.]|uniref:CocE/NonD family hydrolase n=1 Tax=Pigmentiphaga sp. TaxID=1977564 RepID=UPI003B56D568